MPESVGGTARTHLRAIATIVPAFALFSLADMLMKHLTGRYPLVQAMALMSAVALVPIVALALATGGWPALATRRPGLQLARALIGMTTGGSAFFAFTRMPLAEVYAILFAAPLIITALSGPFLGERVDARRWAAVAAGFAGVLIMLRPGIADINLGALGAVASASCYSVSAIIVRRAGPSEGMASFPFYGNLVTVALLGPFAAWAWVPPAAADVPLLIATGLASGVALFCLLSAFRMAPAPVVAPFQYTQMLWGVLYGLLVFGDVPSPWLPVGGGIVVASGLYLLSRERRCGAPRP